MGRRAETDGCANDTGPVERGPVPDSAGTRRRLLRLIFAGAATAPLVACNDSGGQQGSTSGNRSSSAERTGGSGCCCLLKGTRVSTLSGERPVEELHAGDEVVTLSGPKPIRWIGYRKYARDADRPWQRNVMPIRIARFAIDDCAPHRDLYLSPAHCVFIDGVLIPVKHLVNGASIAPAAPAGADTVEYYHVEFDTHEVLHAEGAPVESFMEESSEREYFSNFVEYERRYGRERGPRMKPFAPILGSRRSRRQQVADFVRLMMSDRVSESRQIQVTRDRLARRAEAAFI